jgi:hypothetical protein
MKYIIKIFNEENKNKIIGILTLLILLWLILYLIPELFVNLFGTILGNLILLFITILVISYDIKLGLILGLLFIIIFRFSQISRTKEGFEFNKYSIHDFILLQSTINPNKIFDINMIKNQATQEELDYFNRNGKWPWSQNTKDLYIKALKKNPYIKVYSDKYSLNYIMTVYNEAAILRLLSYQTKEGQFLINGVLVNDPSGNSKEELPSGFGDFAYKSGLKEDRTRDIIKCNMNKENGATLERITFTGKGGIYGEQNTSVNPVDYNDLENIIPGFKFLNGPCNPCGAINENPDYSCPFKLKIKDKPSFISDVWQTLWGINDKPLQSYPSFLQEYIDPEKFPLLSELQTELNK